MSAAQRAYGACSSTASRQRLADTTCRALRPRPGWRWTGRGRQPPPLAAIARSVPTIWQLHCSRAPTRQSFTMDHSHDANGAAHTWIGSKGAAAVDLRSDTATRPTLEMLAAVQTTTLHDDVMGEDKTTNDLQSHVASLTGKEAGLFVLSGTMGNQLALRSLLTQPPHAVVADYRSHILVHEAGGVASLSGAQIVPVVPGNGMYLTLEDVRDHVSLSDDIHSTPTRVISLENTLHGMVMPLDELTRISEFARANGIKMHCDGARLWEAVAAGAGSLRDYAQHFDTVNLCFSKGLGAPVGSIVVGPGAVIGHARWMRKAIGGGIRQSGVLTAAARVALDATFGKGPSGQGGLLRATHATAKRVEALWAEQGGRMLKPVQTNMCWLDLRSMDCSPGRFVELGAQLGLVLSGNRIITHYQVGEETVRRLGELFKTLAAEKRRGGSAAAGAEGSGPYNRDSRL